jgi:penicillin-insensitive murein endopeptidase
MIREAALVLSIALAASFNAPLHAQTIGSVDPKPLPPLAKPNDPKNPAKELFGRKTGPADLPARAIGFYARGCLAGAQALPFNGETWQVMRPSRNRNWGHPDLVRVLKSLAATAPKLGWRGLLVGDMAQARGGPMLTGHASHQSGLDADIWLTPMPDRELTRREREEMSAINVVRADRRDIDPEIWTPQHAALIRAAAKNPRIERIIVNPAIKKALCREADSDRAWLNKVRPWWGHNYHFHIRITCPKDSPDCKPQDPVPAGDGCGAELAYWFQDHILNPPPPKVPPKPKPPLTMADLPAACAAVLRAP